MHDLAVIIVSTNDVRWLRPCLRSVFERAGDLSLDVVIADNESTDGTSELIDREFPTARTVRCRNRGFGHGNNRALMTCNARYVLFLNPDTELLEGTLEELVARLDCRPDIGMAGVRQLTADGALYPTIRQFPDALCALGEAIAVERFPRRLLGRLRTRVLDERAYDHEVDCDWFTGAFMLVRAEALLGAGIFDERFFMSSEEVDLAYRIRQAGWRVVHVPEWTILHHVHMGEPLGERMLAQYAFARRQYAEKHFSAAHRRLFLGFVALRAWIQLAASFWPKRDPVARRSAIRILRTLRGAEPPPYGEPPATAIADAYAVVAAGEREPTVG